MRSMFATAIVILTNNVHLKQVVYDDVPRSQLKNLLLRCMQASVVIMIDFSIVKYISLVFQGVTRNLTPMATLLLSALLLGEKFTAFDMGVMFVSLVAVLLITVGITKVKSETDLLPEGVDESSSSEFKVIIASFAAFAVPILNAWGSITIR